MFIYLLNPAEYRDKIAPIFEKHHLTNFKATFLVIIDENFITDTYINKEMNMMIIRPRNLTKNLINKRVINELLQFLEDKKNKEVSIMVGKRDGKIEAITIFVNKTYNKDDKQLYQNYPDIKPNKIILNNLDKMHKISKQRNFDRGI